MFDPFTGALALTPRPADIPCGGLAFDPMSGMIRWALGPLTPWTPLALFTTRQGAWYEPLAGSIWQTETTDTPTTAPSQAVGRMADLSGQGHHATQGTEANRPLLQYQYAAQHGPVLEASDAADSDVFGNSVALSADGALLVVGASGWEGAVGSGQGGVYTYTWNGTGWAQVGSVLEAADAADLHEFGASCVMSADGQRLVVGASGWHSVGATTSRTGGVYTFAWNGASWDQVGSVLIASDPKPGNKYGGAVALSADGTRLVVGDYYWDDTAVATRNYGGVYTYAWTGTAWSEIAAPFRPADSAASDQFGWALSLSADGQRLVVGAPTWEGAAGSNRGGVYTFSWTGSTWAQVGAVLEAFDAADSDRFGYSVALSADGTRLVVGALDWEGSVGTGRGGVYHYAWTGTDWSQIGSVLEARDAADSDGFGGALALSADGTRMVVGAMAWEGAVGNGRGGVYTYGLTTTPYRLVRHDATDTLTATLPDLGGGQYSAAGSVYFAVPQGLAALHGVAMGTTHNLPAISSDIYGWWVFPERLHSGNEARLSAYALQLAGLLAPDYLLDELGATLTDETDNPLLAG